MNTSRGWAMVRTIVIGTLIFLTPTACRKLDQIDVPTTNPNPSVGALPSPPPSGTVIVGQPPTPTPVPTASPVGSPASSPSPSASPNAGSCALAAMPEGSPCRAESPSFQTQVESAQADVLKNRPDLFDAGRVRSEDTYVQEVARVLRTKGLCAAQGGPKDEVAVKTTNDFNDQYDIVLGSGQPWTSYQVTCRPARF
jgi:hypothetical protein